MLRCGSTGATIERVGGGDEAFEMTPEKRVQLFLNAMTKWEKRVFPRLDDSTPKKDKIFQKELEAIYQEHLSTTGWSRKRFGMNLEGGLSAQDPPKFDQEVIKVEETAKRSVFRVTTRPRQDPGMLWRFIVSVDAKGVPRIDDLEGRVLSKPEEKKNAKGQWDELGPGEWEHFDY